MNARRIGWLVTLWVWGIAFVAALMFAVAAPKAGYDLSDLCPNIAGIQYHREAWFETRYDGTCVYKRGILE